MRFSKPLAAIGVAATLVLSAACGNESGSDANSGDSTGPLKIYSLAAMSGNLAAVGGAMTTAQKAAVAVVNANGGVFGKPIELVVIDDGGTAPRAVAEAQKLIADNSKPGIVVPGNTSVEVSATAPIFASAGWFISTHSTDPSLNDPKKYPNLFGNAFLTKDSAEALAVEFEKKGFRRVGIITSDDQTGRNFIVSEKPALESRGMTVEIVYVPSGTVEATPQLQQLLAKNPDVLLMDGYGANAAPLIKARRKLMPNVPTYGGPNLATSNLASIAPAEDYDGIVFEAISTGVKGSPITETESFKTFLDALLKEAGGKLDFTMNTYLVAYNDIILAAAAANLANSTDPAKMSAALESAKADQLPLYVGPVNFSSERHYPNYGSDWWMFVPYGPIENGLMVPKE